LKFTTLEHEFIKQRTTQFSKKIKFNAEIRYQVVERTSFPQQRGFTGEYQMQTIKRLTSLTITCPIIISVKQSTSLKSAILKGRNIIQSLPCRNLIITKALIS
jgi:hypothetical protein